MVSWKCTRDTKVKYPPHNYTTRSRFSCSYRARQINAFMLLTPNSNPTIQMMQQKFLFFLVFFQEFFSPIFCSPVLVSLSGSGQIVVFSLLLPSAGGLVANLGWNCSFPSCPLHTWLSSAHWRLHIQDQTVILSQFVSASGGKTSFHVVYQHFVLASKRYLFQMSFSVPHSKLHSTPTIKPICFGFGNLISLLDSIPAILPTSCTTLINAPLLILVCLPTFHCSLLTKTGFQRPHWLSSLSQRAHLQIPSKRFTPTSVSIPPCHPLSLTISLQFHRLSWPPAEW